MPWIVGGAILGAGVIGSMGQQDANQSTANSVANQMAFQERMSNTSYQRGVQDMEKAGLNPMLAYMKGGASAPSGASMVYQNELTPLANSAASAAPTIAAYENTKANTGKTVADTEVSKQLAYKAAQEGDLTKVAADRATLELQDKYPEELAKLRAERASEEIRAAFGIAEHETGIQKQMEEGRRAKSERIYLDASMAARVAQQNELLKHMKAETPGLQAIQARDETWYGKNVRPYLGDVSSAASGLTKLMIFKRLMGD